MGADDPDPFQEGDTLCDVPPPPSRSFDRGEPTSKPDPTSTYLQEDPFGDLSTGAELGGRYRLERILGKGATGVVFEASHLVIGKRVALKCLYPHHRTKATAVERFFREARIAATVEHPNVIQVFDGGDEKDTLYLAMELLKGESLGDRIERGPLSVNDAVRIFIGIMDGVAAVHARGVVHRDLKPDNIFLVEPRRASDPPIPKVLDFGISKLKEPGRRELTTLGTVMGTPFYMAPEQMANTRDVDARADVYSLGVMLYEALSGQVPYFAESVLDIFKAAQSDNAPPVEQLRNDVPAELSQIVRRAMRPSREERHASVAEMVKELRRAAVLMGTADLNDDVRETVRDVTSPLIEHERRSTATGSSEAHTPAAGGAVPFEERETLRPATSKALILGMPLWAWAVVLGSTTAAVVSVLIAIVVLSTG